MISPEHHRDVRMAARHHVQGRVLEGGGQIRVVRVFRGPLKRGAILSLDLDFHGNAQPLPGDPLRSDFAAFQKAKYVEAFYDGEPPRVVWEQVKFLSTWTWRPTGDPSVIGYSW